MYSPQETVMMVVPQHTSNSSSTRLWEFIGCLLHQAHHLMVHEEELEEKLLLLHSYDWLPWLFFNNNN